MKNYNGKVGVRSDKGLKIIDNGIAQYLIFIRSANHLKGSLFKIGKTFGLRKEVLKKAMDHEATFEDTWEEKQQDWDPFLRKDYLSAAFVYARYSKYKQEMTGTGR